jgi:hypothetical protein
MRVSFLIGRRSASQCFDADVVAFIAQADPGTDSRFTT